MKRLEEEAIEEENKAVQAKLYLQVLCEKERERERERERDTLIQATFLLHRARN